MSSIYNDPEYNDNRPEQPNDDTPQFEAPTNDAKRRKVLIFSAIGAGIILVALIVLFFVTLSAKNKEIEEQKQEAEQSQLEIDMLNARLEFQDIEAQFSSTEGSIELIRNDSIFEKYQAARQQVEKLLEELNNEKSKSAAQIKKLQDEIATLKGILRDYTERINALMEENEGLRQENENVKNENTKLQQDNNNLNREKKQLTETVTLGKKLAVSGVVLQALNKKGKDEKHVGKATKLMVRFNITENNISQAGTKTIYLRIVSPEGELLGNAGTFDFEGSTIPFTARTNVEYANEEIGGVTIYWDVNTTLTPGQYTVELFCDGFRLASRAFTLNK